jgi:hypothetical protein
VRFWTERSFEPNAQPQVGMHLEFFTSANTPCTHTTIPGVFVYLGSGSFPWLVATFWNAKSTSIDVNIIRKWCGTPTAVCYAICSFSMYTVVAPSKIGYGTEASRWNFVETGHELARFRGDGILYIINNSTIELLTSSILHTAVCIFF